ncbi:MAG: hypothetical protein ABIQ02_01160, partial [Saprospiraceae bacterium]
WEQAIKNDQLYIIVTFQEVIIKRIRNRIKHEMLIDCISDNEEFSQYSIPADEIREVWKVRMKLTSHLEPPSSQVNTNSIAQQLMNQQKMLENLHHHFTKSLVE